MSIVSLAGMASGFDIIPAGETMYFSMFFETTFPEYLPFLSVVVKINNKNAAMSRSEKI